MKKIKMMKGVVVMTLTATVYRGSIRTTYSSRIGFCGEYNKDILEKIGGKFKKMYAEQIEAKYGKGPLAPDKMIYRVRTNSTECEMILNGL